MHTRYHLDGTITTIESDEDVTERETSPGQWEPCPMAPELPVEPPAPSPRAKAPARETKEDREEPTRGKT